MNKFISSEGLQPSSAQNLARWYPTSAEPYGPLPQQSSYTTSPLPGASNTIYVTRNGQPYHEVATAYQQILHPSSGIHMIPVSSSTYAAPNSASSVGSSNSTGSGSSFWVNMKGPIVYPMNQSIPSPFHQSYIDAYAGKTGRYMY
jgi:hypothetical protein